MTIDTRNFGALDIDPQNVIKFPYGLPGFEDAGEFVIVSLPEDSTFTWLQCINIPDVAFPMINPAMFISDYQVEISDHAVETLSLQEDSKAEVYCLVVVPEQLSKISANLKAPIVINPVSKIGIQEILENKDYPLKYFLVKDDHDVAEAETGDDEQC